MPGKHVSHPETTPAWSEQWESNPRKSGWKPDALPFGHARVEPVAGVEPASCFLTEEVPSLEGQTGGEPVETRRIELRSLRCERSVRPLYDVPAGQEGIEPSSAVLEAALLPEL